MGIPRFTNPSDYLIKIAVDPKMINPEVSTLLLAAKCRAHYSDERASLQNVNDNGLKVTMIGE